MFFYTYPLIFHTVSLMPFFLGYVSFAHTHSVRNSCMNMIFHKLNKYRMKSPCSHSLSLVFLWQSSSPLPRLDLSRSRVICLNICYGEYCLYLHRYFPVHKKTIFIFPYIYIYVLLKYLWKVLEKWIHITKYDDTLNVWSVKNTTKSDIFCLKHVNVNI